MNESQLFLSDHKDILLQRQSKIQHHKFRAGRRFEWENVAVGILSCWGPCGAMGLGRDHIGPTRHWRIKK